MSTREEFKDAFVLLRVIFIDMPDFDTSQLPFTCRHGVSADWLRDVAAFKPDVIVTRGADHPPVMLSTMPRQLAQRWISVDPNATPDAVKTAIIDCWEGTIYAKPIRPLVSVYTGVHKTGALVWDAYECLRTQTYADWEWVVVSDVRDERTERYLHEAAERDPRVRVFQTQGNGRVGNTKDMASRLCRGEFLVELDHDDILLPTALDDIVRAFVDDPNLGFVYSDCAEAMINGGCIEYGGPDWEGRYRDESFMGREYRVADSHDINAAWGDAPWERVAWFLTIGPNHVRAFRRSEFMRLGGYNYNMHVADDWDLMARFFLNSSCLHIPKFLYVQRYAGSNTQRRHGYNAMIQYSMDLARQQYVEQFWDAISVRSWRAARPLPEPDGRLKLLTIVVPTWNSDALLQQLLPELLDPRVAVKVVQDGYSQRTRALVEAIANATDADLQYCCVGAQPKPAFGDAQRIWACAECDTPYMWIVDDDNAVYEGAVSRVLEALERDSPDALFVNIDYDGKHAGLPGLNAIDIESRDDIRFQHCDTLNVIFNPRVQAWDEHSYTADFRFISRLVEKAQKLCFLGGERVARYHRQHAS